MVGRDKNRGEPPLNSVLSEGVSRAVRGRLARLSPGVQPLLVIFSGSLPATPCSPDCRPGSGEQARAAVSSPLKPGLRAARGWKVSQSSSPSVLQREPPPPPEAGPGRLCISEGRPGAHSGFWREHCRSLRPASHPSSQSSARSTILFLFCPLSDFFFFKGRCSYREAK